MFIQVLKTILAGLLVGLALFMLPFFILKIFLFFFLVKAAFRLLGFGSHRRKHFAEKFKNMTEEEKVAFRQKFGRGCGCYVEDYQTAPKA